VFNAIGLRPFSRANLTPQHDSSLAPQLSAGRGLGRGASFKQIYLPFKDNRLLSPSLSSALRKRG